MSSKKVTSKSQKARSYSADDMEQAIIQSLNGHNTIRGISQSFGITKTTLLRHVGRVQEGKSSPVAMGRKSTLTDMEELYTADWVNQNAIVGFAVLAENLLEEVKKVLDKTGRVTAFLDNRPSKSWVKLFFQKHNLAYRTTEGISKGQAMVTPADIQQWFED